MTDSSTRGAAKEIVECVEEFLKQEGWIARDARYEHTELEKNICAIIEQHQNAAAEIEPGVPIFELVDMINYRDAKDWEQCLTVLIRQAEQEKQP